MKKILLLSVILAFLITGNAIAATLEWKKNTEIDMKDYLVYGCFVTGCVVLQNSLPLGIVTQPVTGLPSFLIDLKGKEGNVAISARDLANNESGLSVTVPFDFVPPKNPTDIVIR